MPRRLILRPGSAVLRRDPEHIQIGPVVINDRPGLIALLRSGDIEPDDALVRHLHGLGALIDVSQWPGGLDHAELACASVTGRDPAQLAGRRNMRVRLDGADLAFPLTDLLQRSGVRTNGEPDVVVLVSIGEPAREALDVFVCAGTAVLPVAVDGPVVHVGPFTVPDLSPCLRCHDEQRIRWDPGWRALVAQFGTSPTHGLSIDAVRLHLAAGYVAGELLRFADGEPPESLGQRVTLDGDQRSALATPFAPDCTCHF